MPDYRHEDFIRHVVCDTPVELRWLPRQFQIVGEGYQYMNTPYCPKCERPVRTSELSSPGPYSAVWAV